MLPFGGAGVLTTVPAAVTVPVPATGTGLYAGLPYDDPSPYGRPRTPCPAAPT